VKIIQTNTKGLCQQNDKPKTRRPSINCRFAVSTFKQLKNTSNVLQQTWGVKTCAASVTLYMKTATTQP